LSIRREEKPEVVAVSPAWHARKDPAPATGINNGMAPALMHHRGEDGFLKANVQQRSDQPERAGQH
jgi:hypothetical protein